MGAALGRELVDKFEVVDFNHAQLDLADANQIQTKIDDLDFDVLINAAAMTNVDLCQTERDRAFAISLTAIPRVSRKQSAASFNLPSPPCASAKMLALSASS